jgi:hypothetical protein
MLVSLLYQHGLLFTGLFMLALFMATGLLGQRVILHLVPLEQRRAHNDVLSAASATAGFINAVLLAFIVFVAWTSYDRAREVVSQESSLTADLFADATVLQGDIGGHVRGELLEYVTTVVDSEWPAMANGLMGRGTTARRPGWQALRHTYADLLELEPTSKSQELVIGEMLKRLNSLYDARRQRLSAASGGSLSPVVWSVVLAAGLLSLAFCWLFGFETGGLHVASTSMVAACLGLVIFLIVALDRPFRGPNQISVEPFTAAQNMMRTALQRPK